MECEIYTISNLVCLMNEIIPKRANIKSLVLNINNMEEKEYFIQTNLIEEL